jgi:RecB family exonuclease
MLVRILWTPREWAEAVADLPGGGPLPARTVLVPRESVAHSLRRDLLRLGRGDVLAGTGFVPLPAAAIEALRAAGASFVAGEEALRAPRLAAVLKADHRLVHFDLGLLRAAPGWNEAFAQSISDLEGAGLLPADLEGSGSGRQRDIAVLWRALDESAGRSWTLGRIYLEAAVVLAGRPEVWPFRGATLAFVAGGLSAAGARFLLAIPGATLGLAGARPARARHFDRIEALLGTEAGAALRGAVAPRPAVSERDLLAAYLFEPPAVLADPARPRSPGPDGTVALEEHAGVEAEVEATTDWVARQVVGGTPLVEIAVLAPERDPLVALVADRLARLPWHDGMLPVHVSGGLPLARFTAGARGLALVRGLRAHLPATALADVLPALRLVGGGRARLSRGDAEELGSRLGSAGGSVGNPDGALEWSARVADRLRAIEVEVARGAAVGDGADSGARSRAREIERVSANLTAIRPAFDAVVRLAARVARGETLSVLWPALHDFLQEWLVQPADGPRVEAVLAETLAAAAADGACGTISGDEALRVIERAVLGARVPVGRFGEPRVFVGALADAVGLAFTAVRVIGLAEGRLPAVGREDPVFPEILRGAWGGGAGLIPSAGDCALEGLHALDLVVRAASAQVAFSVPRLDVERSEREPSSVMLEAAAALGRPNRVTGAPAAVVPDRVALERDAFTPARASAGSFRRDFPIGEAAWQDGIARRALGIPSRWRGAPALDLARIEHLGAAAPGSMDGLLGEAALELPVPGLGPERPIAPRALEEILRCPHAYLLESLLGFGPPAGLDSPREIAPNAYGSLFHDVAAAFYDRNGSPFCSGERTLAEWLRDADRLVDQTFDAFVAVHPLAGPAVRAQQRERLRHDVRELIEYDWRGGGAGRFVAAERTFGEPVSVEVPAGGGVLYVRGRIDRLDVVADRTLVRDLKTSRVRARVGKEAGPDPAGDVQIALYGMVAAALAESWGLPSRIGAAYVHFGRGRAAERSFRDDFHGSLEPAAREWLAAARGLLVARVFPRTPVQEDCKYCDFRPVCGQTANERAAQVLAGSAGALARFSALKQAADEETN